MAFIKHGDGKIISVVDPDELTDEQKKQVKTSQKEEKKSDKKTN